MFLMTSVMRSSSQIQPDQRKSFDGSVFDLKSLFCSHRLHSLHGGSFPLCIVVWRCLGGAAGEEDEVIFGLKDLREMKLNVGKVLTNLYLLLFFMRNCLEIYLNVLRHVRV